MALGTEENSLPTTQDDLDQLKQLLVLHGKKSKTNIVWECNLQERLSPPLCITQVANMVPEAGANSAGQKKLSFVEDLAAGIVAVQFLETK